VYITTAAMLNMQVHCHLIKNEVIGFLAGYIINLKNDKKTLVITEAYPAESLK
jgi:hypothetical protein